MAALRVGVVQRVGGRGAGEGERGPAVLGRQEVRLLGAGRGAVPLRVRRLVHRVREVGRLSRGGGLGHGSHLPFKARKAYVVCKSRATYAFLAFVPSGQAKKTRTRYKMTPITRGTTLLGITTPNILRRCVVQKPHFVTMYICTSK